MDHRPVRVAKAPLGALTMDEILDWRMLAAETCQELRKGPGD
jgi:hypothetical protein